MVKQRNIPILQYRKGQQIKATDVNDRFKLVFKEFNDMAPSDVEPVTTGQFRVFEPSIGLKIEAKLTTASDWVVGNGAATGANTFVCAVGVSNWYTVASGAPGAYYDFLTIGNRYLVYANITTAVGTGIVGLYNAHTMTNPIVGRTGAPGTFTLFVAFTAITQRLAIGATSSDGNLDVTINPVTDFDATDFAIYIFDLSKNEWLIPNYCGWQYPVSSLAVVNGERREAHLLLEKAIKKEIDATNEVLRYI